MKEKLVNNKGITLIALVITIIVLLILAGVSIAMLAGENGILKQANEAKNKTEQATIEELKKLAQAEANLNLEEKKYTDKSNQVVTIPAGMAVSPIQGENEVNKGLVAIDKNGNEWVWVEVPKSITETSTTDDQIETALQAYATVYRESGFTGYTDTWYEGCGLTQTDYNTNKSKMLQSIKENGGFWTGRYETGTENVRTSTSDISTLPLIQQNKYAYNYVTCSEAQQLSTQLSPNNNCNTSLMYGIQWDLICKFLETKLDKTQEEIKVDSSNWGNYSNASFDLIKGEYSLDAGKSYIKVTEKYQKLAGNVVLTTTGSSEKMKALNIYDFAGNEYEYTLEKASSSGYPAANRGGFYMSGGSDIPASFHNGNSIIAKMDRLGFRVALY